MDGTGRASVVRRDAAVRLVVPEDGGGEPAIALTPQGPIATHWRSAGVRARIVAVSERAAVVGEHDEHWQKILGGERPAMRRIRRVFSRIPSGDRCKLCTAPFGMPGAAMLGLFGIRRSRINPWLCRFCLTGLEKKPGGAEIEVSLLFADVRGSTALGETQSPGEFRDLMSRFYGAAARAVNRRDGVIDKFVGDEVIALFIPGFVGADRHPNNAIEAGLELLSETGHGSGSTPWIEVGGGVHTGVAFVGTTGSGDVLDFTALGDPVNVAARLASEARAGELLVSRATAEAAAIDAVDLPQRSLRLRGRGEPVDVLVLGN